MTLSLFKNRQSMGIAAVFLALFIGMGAIIGNQLFLYRDTMLEERRQKTRELVENVTSLVLFYYLKVSKEDLPEADAKKFAIQAIRELHYDDSAYFWITDMNNRVIMHPTQSHLEGQDMSAFKDPLGKPIFQEMGEIVRFSGSGYMDYYWTKPGEDKNHLYPKMSYVKGFEPWGWIIGSGLYIDDVNESFRSAVYLTASLAIALLVFTIALAITISEALRRR